MPEGVTHVALVNEILNLLMEDGRAGYAVLTDRAGEHVDSRCPILGGYIPDVYGIAARDSQMRAVGEAKSGRDFGSQRTEPQIKAFLHHLSVFERPTLVVAVPFVVVSNAVALVKRILPPEVSHVRVMVIAPHLRRLVAPGWME